MTSSGPKQMAWAVNLVLATVMCLIVSSPVLSQDAPAAPAPAKETPAAPAPAPAAPAAPAPAKVTPAAPAPTAPAAPAPAPAAEVPTAPVGPLGLMGLPTEQVPAELQQNFLEMVHYWRIARLDLAADFANRVASANPDPTALLAMVEGKADGKDVGINLLDTMAAGDSPELAEAAKKLLAITLQGVDVKKKDGKRIQASLEGLGKNQRAYELNLRELKYSGEYVVPYAMGLLADGSKKTLHDDIMMALVAIDRPVVYPLVLGLGTDNESVRLMIIDTLSKLGYKIAVPALKALVENQASSEAVKKAAGDAIVHIAGPEALAASARKLYFELAESLYYDKLTILADTKRPMTDTWGFSPGGVEYRPAPTQSVNEIMAGQMAEAGLKAAKEAPELVSLWLSIRAQLKVELAGSDAKNPWDVANQPTTEFFLMSAGQQYLFDVLDRALADDHIAVSRQAIRALEQVANQNYLGAAALASGSPLIRALSYEDRMVRFEAAFAIVAVEPKKEFLHSDQVVPVLAQAVNLQTGSGVLVIDGDQNNLNRLVGEFRKAGWNVADAASGNEGISKAHGMARIDGILLAANVENVNYVEVVQLLRNNFATAMVPIIILSAEAEPVAFSHLKKNQKYLAQAAAAATFAELVDKMKALQEEAGSVALAPEGAKAVSLRAAQALAFVATADLVFKAAPARSALMQAAAGKDQDLAMAAMKALVQMPDQEIQQHLASIALKEGASPAIQIAALDAVAQIARHIGNQLQTADVTTLRTRVGTLTDKENAIKDAIGRCLGALDLDPKDATQFILKYATQ